MKKLVAILLLLLYGNIALGVGIDCHYCGAKLANVKLLGFGNATCKCSANQASMGCCQDKTFVCKSDNHTNQAVTFNPSLFSTDYLNEHSLISKVGIQCGNPVCIQINIESVRSSSGREILSLLHILRI